MRFAVLTILAILAFAGCTKSARSEDPNANAGHGQHESSLTGGSRVVANARLLERKVGGQPYCLVREVDGNEWKLPVLDMASDADWVTHTEITLNTIKYGGSHCCDMKFDFSGSSMTITKRKDGTFGVHIQRGGVTLLWDIFQYPKSGPCTTCYLESVQPRCKKGEPHCGAFGGYHAYAYVVDAAPKTDRHVPKIVFIDFFDPDLVNAQCDLERPPNAIVPTSCDLSPLISDIVLEARQAGTGGGREPPG